MNLFNDEKLAYRLKKNEVLPREQFFYYVVTMFGVYVLLYLPESQFLLLEFVTTCLIGAITCYNCYRINMRGDNDRFIERYVCLGVPIMIKIIVFALIVTIALTYVGYLYFGEDFIDSGLEDERIDIGCAVLEGLYLYYRYTKDFKIIASKHDK